MTGRAATVEEYLAEQSLERREALAAVRRVILENLPVGYAEVMQYCHDQLRDTPGEISQNLQQAAAGLHFPNRSKKGTCPST